MEIWAMGCCKSGTAGMFGRDLGFERLGFGRNLRLRGRGGLDLMQVMRGGRERRRLRAGVGEGEKRIVAVRAASPADYEFRADCMPETVEFVKLRFPELMDLVEDGTLVVVQRPEEYVERRSDGYVEPETVIVVGTAHVSRVSAEQVTRVVQTVRPDNVVVELCRSRAGTMYESITTSPGDANGDQQMASNAMSISGESFWTAISRSMKLGGRSALALRLLLGGMSQRISRSAGIVPGEEFRAARIAAEDVGAQVVLGDRPIEITLKRAWDGLSWKERFFLGGIFYQSMLSTTLDISEDAIKMLKSDDLLSTMFAELSLRLPSLMQPLIHERDMYLAWSLKRSNAVNRCKTVVGVVGQGHMRGIVYNLKNNQENLRFKDLVGAREPESKARKGQTIIRNILVEIAIGYILWLLFDVVVMHH